MAEGFITRRGLPTEPPTFFLSFDGVDDHIIFDDDFKTTQYIYLSQIPEQFAIGKINGANQRSYMFWNTGAYPSGSDIDGLYIVTEQTGEFRYSRYLNVNTILNNGSYIKIDLINLSFEVDNTTYNLTTYLSGGPNVNWQTWDFNETKLMASRRRLEDPWEYAEGIVHNIQFLDSSSNPLHIFEFNEGIGTLVQDSIGSVEGTIFGATWGQE